MVIFKEVLICVVIFVFHWLTQDKIQESINGFSLPATINRKNFDIYRFSKWKASEYRTFFLYMAVPILKEFLKPKYFWNLACIVFGIFVYLSFAFPPKTSMEFDRLPLINILLIPRCQYILLF